MRIYFTKAYWQVFGIAAAFLTIFILGIVGFTEFKNRNGEYMTYENEYGGETLRVTKVKGGFPLPKDFPEGIIDIYPNLRLRDVYVIRNDKNEIMEIQVEGYSNDDVETVEKYYEDEKNDKFDSNYERRASISEANTEYTKKENIVAEKTSIIIYATKR